MPLDRWRVYDPHLKKYSGWYSGRRMTRARFSEVSGIHIATLKAWEKRGVKPNAASLEKLRRLQLEVNAGNQCDMLDHKAERAAAAAAAKAAAAREREQDKALDKALARCKPLSKRAKQTAIF